MEVAITDISEVEKEISIDVPSAELSPHFEKAYKDYIPKIEIRGFRKGKAPLDLVKKLHGETIEYNSLDTVATDLYRQAVEERNIQPIGDPVLTDMKYERGKKLSFKIKYEIKPRIELKEYKGVAAELVRHIVTEKEIEDEILRLRKANSTTVEVQTVTDDEHIVTSDVQELDDNGTPLIGRKTKAMKMYLSDETLAPEVKEALRPAAVGTNRRVKFETEHEGHKHKHHYDFQITKIEKIELPEFNDELVKKTTKDKVTTTEQFRKELRADLENYWKERCERKLMDAIIREIVNRHALTVPETLVKGVIDSVIEDMKNRYPNKKLPADFKEAEFRSQNRDYAVFQAKWYLIRERIIDAENIKADDADVERLAEEEAVKVGIDKERLVSFYKQSGAVKDRVVSDKLMRFLREKATITERTTEEFID